MDEQQPSRTPGTTDAVQSATEQSRERAGGDGTDVAHRPGEGPPIETGTPGEDAAIDGAAEDAGPGDVPEGATPKVPRSSGDPLADAHGPA